MFLSFTIIISMNWGIVRSVLTRIEVKNILLQLLPFATMKRDYLKMHSPGHGKQTKELFIKCTIYT